MSQLGLKTCFNVMSQKLLLYVYFLQWCYRLFFFSTSYFICYWRGYNNQLLNNQTISVTRKYCLSLFLFLLISCTVDFTVDCIFIEKGWPTNSLFWFILVRSVRVANWQFFLCILVDYTCTKKSYSFVKASSFTHFFRACTVQQLAHYRIIIPFSSLIHSIELMSNSAQPAAVEVSRKRCTESGLKFQLRTFAL